MVSEDSTYAVRLVSSATFYVGHARKVQGKVTVLLKASLVKQHLTLVWVNLKNRRKEKLQNFPQQEIRTKRQFSDSKFHQNSKKALFQDEIGAETW